MLGNTIGHLRSENDDRVTQAALRLGLLLERHRFCRAGGHGTLGDVERLFGGHAHLELSDSDAEHVLQGLLAHVEDRDSRANPAVIWAIGKAHNNLEAIERVAELAERILADLDHADLLYQALAVVSVCATDRHKPLLIRAARECTGESAELARNVLAMRHWS
ncbi:hypothetical protein [Actinopolymorpha sp. B9G3]|uniref:hypothetical protein n=1 Tax=Actinopolymorpha sp. B9G3 TaxID=3158970 RepID=UPI0032D8C694